MSNPFIFVAILRGLGQSPNMEIECAVGAQLPCFDHAPTLSLFFNPVPR